MSTVRVKVLVPQQEFYFHYDEGEWNDALKEDEVTWFMDRDLSDIEPQMEIYGPDGALVTGWSW